MLQMYCAHCGIWQKQNLSCEKREGYSDTSGITLKIAGKGNCFCYKCSFFVHPPPPSVCWKVISGHIDFLVVWHYCLSGRTKCCVHWVNVNRKEGMSWNFPFRGGGGKREIKFMKWLDHPLPLKPLWVEKIQDTWILKEDAWKKQL